MEFGVAVRDLTRVIGSGRVWRMWGNGDGGVAGHGGRRLVTVN